MCHIMPALRKANTSVTIDSAVLKAAKRQAKIEHRSLSSLVELCLWTHCQAHDLRSRAAVKASRKA